MSSTVECKESNVSVANRTGSHRRYYVEMMERLARAFRYRKPYRKALLLTGIGLGVLSLGTHEAVASGPAGAADPTQRAEWARSILSVPTATPDCFVATFPEKVWKAVPCGSPPARPSLTPPRPVRPFDEASSGDYYAVSAGTITSASGTLAEIDNVQANYPKGFPDASGQFASNEFSLQLNTNSDLPADADHSICSKSTNKGCHAWLQFVYDSGGSIYAQAWMINYLTGNGDSCPSGYNHPKALPNDCWTNIAYFSLPSPLLQFKDLEGSVLTGTVASDGTVTVTFYSPAKGMTFKKSGSDITGVYGHWGKAEFNVFGNSGGDKSLFNATTLVSTTLTLVDGSSKDPACNGSVKDTAETTNLDLTGCTDLSLRHGIAIREGVKPNAVGDTPAGGADLGGTAVRITGGGIADRAVVKFGAATAKGTCAGGSCDVVSPGGSGNTPVTVANLFRDGVAGPSSDPVNFAYVAVPHCTLRTGICPSRPFFGDVPPSFLLSCGTKSDFYEGEDAVWGSLSEHNGFALGRDALSATSLMVTGNAFAAACEPGTQNQCQSFSIDNPPRQLCHGSLPPPTPVSCKGKCNGGRCCPDPDGGDGSICVPASRSCPVLQ